MPDTNKNFIPLRVLVVDDEPNIRLTLSICLEAEGHQVAAQGTINGALDEVARHSFDLILLDLRLGMDNGLDYIPQLVRENPWTKVIVITAYASVDSAVEAMKRGASDYLAKPFDADQVQLVVRRVAERRQLERKIQALQAAMDQNDPEADFPTVDASMIDTLELARQVAQSQANLVIHGEIGVGKGRLARAIHIWSDRAAAPYATVSCRSEQSESLEAELFGSSSATLAGEAGGKVSFCDGGTLLLDEIGEMPMRLQPRLLRLLKEKEYERPDDFRVRAANVRVIAATSSDLNAAVARGAFRADLLLALNVIQIDVPPLRQRRDDIQLLAQRFLAFFARGKERQITGFTPNALYMLNQHSWPGNARELRNVIERAVLVCGSDCIGVEHLPPNLLNSQANIALGDMVPLSDVEETHIRRVVANCRSLRQAASILGIDAGTLCRRMRRYGAGDDQPAA
jgi:NtrC-family two-component system response regulator AlgB